MLASLVCGIRLRSDPRRDSQLTKESSRQESVEQPRLIQPIRHPTALVAITRSIVTFAFDISLGSQHIPLATSLAL
jgi:hypothetical protein